MRQSFFEFFTLFAASPSSCLVWRFALISARTRLRLETVLFTLSIIISLFPVPPPPSPPPPSSSPVLHFTQLQFLLSLYLTPVVEERVVAGWAPAQVPSSQPTASSVPHQLWIFILGKATLSNVIMHSKSTIKLLVCRASQLAGWLDGWLNAFSSLVRSSNPSPSPPSLFIAPFRALPLHSLTVIFSLFWLIGQSLTLSPLGSHCTDLEHTEEWRWVKCRAVMLWSALC